MVVGLVFNTDMVFSPWWKGTFFTYNYDRYRKDKKLYTSLANVLTGHQQIKTDSSRRTVTLPARSPYTALQTRSLERLCFSLWGKLGKIIIYGKPRMRMRYLDKRMQQDGAQAYPHLTSMQVAVATSERWRHGWVSRMCSPFSPRQITFITSHWYTCISLSFIWFNNISEISRDGTDLQIEKERERG